MKLATLLLLFLTLMCAGDDIPVTAAHRGEGLKVELVSEVTAIIPGQPFYMGLFIHHEAGYHTYWKSSGLAGVPTKLEWKLPEGFTSDEIEWPIPTKVKMATINTHGYDHDVLLMVKITPPKNVLIDSAIMKTTASWMCCAKTCHPGYAELTLNLPILRTAAAPAWDVRWRDQFENSRTLIPPPLTGWRLSARRLDKVVVLTGEPTAGATLPEAPQFFSTDNLICSHPMQIWQQDGAGFRATLTISDLPPTDQSRLRGLLWSKGSWIKDATASCCTIDVPLEK